MAKTEKRITSRQSYLQEYLREVARELIMRGIIDAQTGQPPVEILRQRPTEMLGLMMRDLKEAGFSVGNEIVGGAVSGLLSAVFGGKLRKGDSQ